MSVNLELINAIKNNKLIIFVGSGMSKSLGLPDWKQLIKEFLIELSKKDENNKKYQWLLEGMDISLPLSEIDILEMLNEERKTIFQVLTDTIDVNFNENDLSTHRMLGEISKKIITTNYDKVLERALNIRKITPDNDFYIANTPESYIIKLHGCIEIPSKCILFKQNYEDLYNENSSAIQS